jgi:hypothetical protein
MPLTLSYQTMVQAQETLPDTNTPAAPANSKVVTNSNWNTNRTLNDSSTPPVSKTGNGEVTLVSGAATLDLTAVNGANGAAVTGNTLKIRAIKFQADPASTGNFAIVTGASNGKQILGGNIAVRVAAAVGEVVLYLGDADAAISGSSKTLDITGTGTEKLRYQVLFG